MKLRTVKMLKDCKGCPDGINVRPYYKGEEYNLPDSLGRVFVEDLKVAEDVEELVKAPTPPAPPAPAPKAAPKAAKKTT